MTRTWWVRLIPMMAIAGGCARHPAIPIELQPKAFGAEVVLVSGEKQVAGVGAQLDQPVVVQVYDRKGAVVADAPVRFTGAGGVAFQPDRGLAGPDGQFATNVSLGGMAGPYQIVASTIDSSGKRAEVRIEEIAVGYRERLGQQLNAIHCIRCHNPESAPERVSNHDNLSAQAHAFTEGKVLNVISDANLAAIISHGGAAPNKSPEMAPYGNLFDQSRNRRARRVYSRGLRSALSPTGSILCE